MLTQSPAISIVIGAQNSHSTITLCLQSLLRQVGNQEIEILVVDGSVDDTPEIITRQFPQVTLIQGHAQRLIPELWGVGIRQAKAPIVAITTAHCIPSENWISSILQAAHTQAEFAGWGGAILPPSHRSPRDWAVYFCRYSAFMPPIAAGHVLEIAGDNAAYYKATLDAYWKLPEQGFWETLFHHDLRQQGERLYLSPAIETRLGETDNPWHFFRARFQHGKHYGSTRPQTSWLGRAIRICAAPALLPFLVLRIGRRVGQHRPDWIAMYLLSLPWLVFFLIAWSLGEVSGYIQRRPVEQHLQEAALR